MPAGPESNLSPLTMERGYSFRHGLASKDRIFFPEWDIDLSIYDNAGELALYGAFASQMERVLPANKHLPEPLTLSQRDRGRQINGLHVGLQTVDVVGSKEMDKKALRKQAREGLLMQQHRLFVPIEFVSSDYEHVIRSNVVFSARATYYAGRRGKTPSYRKFDAKVMVYGLAEGDSRRLRPVILTPDNPPIERLFGLGIELLKLANR